MVKKRSATKQVVEAELLAIVNRWRRHYPAYLLKEHNGDTKRARIDLMHRDVGFLLQLLKALIEMSRKGGKAK